MKNIFVNWNKNSNHFEVKIGDFGISKVLDNTMKMTSTCIGTPLYMSPESCMGLDYSFKSDIWALGCFLFELSTGKRPFEGSKFQV
jgi:NIMA (never in mitosis gene a)-related kinase